MRQSCGLALMVLTALSAAGAEPADQDRDGLPDEFEQALLVKFLPSFHIAAADCDTAPAEFVPALPAPTVRARNGAIYGQVFPIRRGETRYIEIHYYHLWSKDCGRLGHTLDTESVSGLLRADSPDAGPRQWSALYWYAAAHENTVCDMSNGGPAESIGAVHRGPDVWVSEGKHASFLKRELCRLGCGDDRCDSDRPLRVSRIINLGEPGQPMNGAVWTASPSWPLASKMLPDFSDPFLARIAATSEVDLLPALDAGPGARKAVRVAGHTYASLESAMSDTKAAVSQGEGAGANGVTTGAAAVATAGEHARNSTAKALGAVKNSLKRAFGWKQQTGPAHEGADRP